MSTPTSRFIPRSFGCPPPPQPQPQPPVPPPQPPVPPPVLPPPPPLTHNPTRILKPDLEFDLGTRFFKGQGMDKNYERAAECFQVAATHGHAAAQVNLGYCYYHGYGVPQNVVHARTLFQAALDQGHPGADSLVKQLEDEGSGTAQTPSKSGEAAPASPSPRQKPYRYDSSTGEVEETPQAGKAGAAKWGNSSESEDEEEQEEAVAFACCMSPRKPKGV